MMLITVIFIALTMFLIGFFVGVKDEPPIKIKTHTKPQEDIETLKKEYENFLSYDGSMQE